MRTRLTLAAFVCALGLNAVSAAGCPEHFSPAAKERLKDSIDVEATEHQLNVVYFIGSDSEPVADYERRISELLLYLQQFYAKEMDRNGFGRRAFGLARKQNGNVDILLVRGAKPAAEYSYDGNGARKCLDELNAFYAAHPETKRSRHSFIIMPTLYNATYNDDTPGGVPFFGYGVNCFALDYKDFDIKHLGENSHKGRLLTKWYGGFAHELAHGLNAPHNDGPASLNEKFGMPLLNAGNYTFGLKPTYLTPATACIFDRSETFAPKGDQTDFYNGGAPVPRVSDAKLVFGDDTLKLTLRCHGSCRHLIAYMQDPPYSINRDYDAVSFVGEMGEKRADGSREVSFVIPRAELKALHNDTQQLELLFVGEEGNRSRWNMEIHWPTVLASPATLGIPANLNPYRSGY